MCLDCKFDIFNCKFLRFQRFLQFFERFDLNAPRKNYAYASTKTISQSCALKLDVILDHPDGEYESDDEDDIRTGEEVPWFLPAPTTIAIFGVTCALFLAIYFS